MLVLTGLFMFATLCSILLSFAVSVETISTGTKGFIVFILVVATVAFGIMACVMHAFEAEQPRRY